MSIDGRLVTSFKVTELKNELEKRGLSKSGKKDELIVRLTSYVEVHEESGDGGDAEEVGNGVEEMSKEEPNVTEDVNNKHDLEIATKDSEKEAEIEENQEASRTEEEAEVKPQNIEESEPQEDQLKKEIEEEILKEERRLKREDERRMKAKRPEDEDDVNGEQTIENKQEEENKKEKRKRIEWPKSPKKSSSSPRKSEKEEKKPKSPTKKSDSTPETVVDKVETEDVGADDTLVMEIDQSDMVAEDPAKEDAEPLLEAEPGQVTSLRKLGGKGQEKAGEGERRKRGWGNRGAQRLNSSENLEISSKDLKDIVPDLKPLLTETGGDALEEKDEENGVEAEDAVEGPELPNVNKEDEIPRKKKKRSQDSSETEVIQIVNLTRPFTVNQLKEMLKRTGSIEDFWIDRIKSKCLVHFTTADQASETRMALDGVKWPVSNPKTLNVTFSSKETLQRLKESSEEPGRTGGDLSGRIGGLREWDKNKVNQEGDRSEKREKERKERRDRDRDSEKNREKQTPERKQPSKTLEELFKKTTTTPSIYWIPLSEEQIKEKEEQRNRKIMEADLLRETMNKMMQEKDGGRNKPRLASGRRRSSSRSDSN